MSDKYIDFLESKKITASSFGFEMPETNPLLFDWQNIIVRWALKKGKACIFADCGLGKTAMQLHWAQMVSRETKKPTLIIAPLAVAKQTQREGEKFGIEVFLSRTGKLSDGVNVTNYEMIEHFDPNNIGGVVLDESSILKNYSGKTRKMLDDYFKNTPYKLCCTATPAPNDYMELGSHAEFLGVMSNSEMLATFFCHDGGNTSKWRLKGHAETKFFEWIASWACCMTSPSDLGFNSDGYILPPLNIEEIIVESGSLENDSGQMMLLPDVSMSLNDRRTARRNSLEKRAAAAANIANASDEQFLVWCDLNDESKLLSRLVDGAVEVTGSMSNEEKENAMLGFTSGRYRCLVSKPSIAGWGMNWQQCHNVIFVGLSDSFEAFYQAVRRCYRFGQTRPVNVQIVISDAEGCVRDNIERKRSDADRMTRELVCFTKDILKSEIYSTVRMSESYLTIERMEVPKWLKTA